MFPDSEVRSWDKSLTININHLNQYPINIGALQAIHHNISSDPGQIWTLNNEFSNAEAKHAAFFCLLHISHLKSPKTISFEPRVKGVNTNYESPPQPFRCYLHAQKLPHQPIQILCGHSWFEFFFNSNELRLTTNVITDEFPGYCYFYVYCSRLMYPFQNLFSYPSINPYPSLLHSCPNLYLLQ